MGTARRDGYTEAEAVTHLATLSDAKLSQMIDIIRAQIPLAVKKGDGSALGRLQRHERVVAAARMAKMETGT